MGSINPRPYPEGRALMLMLEGAAKKSIAETGEIDMSAAFAILDKAVSDPLTRERVIHYLAAYLSRVVLGTIPDHNIWLP